MKSFSVIIREGLHNNLCSHLIREDGQEDLCFATYVPSTGRTRSTGILSQLIFPEVGERKVHGNVGFLPSYFERALSIATTRKEGLVFLHSHPSIGWQGMSSDDVVAENRLAPATMAATGYPLLGLTLGTDGAWSARYWQKSILHKRTYDRLWCDTVRVLGKGLSITFNENILSTNFHAERQLRTMSAWGSKKQEDISRLRVGIVGLGSVGSIVAEILARTGISKFVLIDFDSVEEKNLDRLTNVFADDIGKAKVEVIAGAIKRSATASKVEVVKCEYSICEIDGYKQALDCDVLFSCVDRPWPRQILNFIAYSHLIPVIDGGILVRINKRNGKMIGADWKAQTVGYERTCLECLGQYKTENAGLEKSGKLDDPSYIAGLDTKDIIDAHENVFCFSSHLASMEVFQLISLLISPSGISDVGQQMYHLVTGTLDHAANEGCKEGCFFTSIIGKGDCSGIVVYGSHPIAEIARQQRSATLPIEHVKEKQPKIIRKIIGRLIHIVSQKWQKNSKDT